MVARLQSFPDDWIFAGSKTQAYRQVGNALPVGLAFTVASVVREMSRIGGNMTRLVELQSLIQEMGAGLSRLDHAIAADPNSTSLVLAAKSFRNQYDQIHAEFLAEANRLEETNGKVRRTTKI